MMRKRGSFGRVGKWVGAAVCVALVALFFVSRRVEVKFTNYARGFWINLTPGAVNYAWQPRMALGSYWEFDECDPEIEAVWWPSVSQYRSGGHVMVPIWMAFVLFAIPTAVLWYRDRRGSSMGRCKKCGYDLTLNVSGQCPECGAKIAAAGKAGGD